MNRTFVCPSRGHRGLGNKKNKKQGEFTRESGKNGKIPRAYEAQETHKRSRTFS